MFKSSVKQTFLPTPIKAVRCFVTFVNICDVISINYYLWFYDLVKVVNLQMHFSGKFESAYRKILSVTSKNFMCWLNNKCVFGKQQNAVNYRYWRVDINVSASNNVIEEPSAHLHAHATNSSTTHRTQAPLTPKGNYMINPKHLVLREWH